MDNEVKEIMESYIKQRGAAPPYVEVMAEMEPEILKEWYKMRKKIFEKGVIPRKYKELIVMAMCCARLYQLGAEGHMKAALECGATKEEIFEVMLLAIPGAGIPAFSTSVRAFKSLDKE
jgi:alkylhydroperoxidase/carboxymuconolactone decarboxylase family protein YurZ